MDGLKVLEIIKKINPWFKNNQVPSIQLEPFRRREFSFLIKDLSKLDMATLIIGARRVGKSVLMYQLIDYLLKQGIEGKRILFIQGDNTILTEFAAKENLINYTLDLYQNHIIEKSFNNLIEPIFIFIDEAQHLSTWEREIKNIIDQKYKIKFIVTGSSSFELRRGSENPLTGRISIQPISPFSFSDYVSYNIDDSDQKLLFQNKIKVISDDFKNAFMAGDLKNTFDSAIKVLPFIEQFKLKRKYHNYLYFGGFPWVISNKGSNEYSRYLRDLLTTTISKDIMTQVEIRDAQSFERLMVNLCLMTGKITRFKTFADALGIEERTVIKYIDYYIESHWVSLSSPYVFHSKLDSVRSEKKIYIIDSGIINTLTFKDINEFTADNSYRGHIIENVIYNHLLTFKQQSIGTFQSHIPFWVESDTNKEIDFVFDINYGVIPIEIKLKVSYDGSDLENLAYFMSKRISAKFGVLTSLETLEIRGKILLIPNLILTLLL